MHTGQGSAVVAVVGAGGGEGLELREPLLCPLVHQLKRRGNFLNHAISLQT